MTQPTRGQEEGATPTHGQKLLDLSGVKLGTLNISVLETAAAQQNLQVLDLKDNKITAIPVEVYHAFPQIKILDLRKNALEEVLPNISAMQALEDLLIDQNCLREVPVEVCHLPKLAVLSLSQNLLKSLPLAIGDMKLLRSFNLADNQVKEIPAEIGACSQLQTLYLHHNHFTKVPTTFCQLENLSELALEWFRYTTPPLPRVIKGTELKQLIVKLTGICKDKRQKGESFLSCIEVLTQFSRKSFDPNAIDSKRRTRLHVACLEGHVGVAMALAECGSKCDSLDNEGYSPLLVAVREEHPDIASALVRAGIDVNCGGGLFGSPLHVATVNFDPQMVLLLIKGKADVNQKDADGNTPLHVLMSVFDKGGKRASAIGNILLQHDADCNMMNSDKWAPLHLAARRGQLRGICFVLNHIDSANSACLRGTCSCQPEQKRSNRVRTCTRVFDLNLRGGSHLWTPLHLAGHASHVPVVQVLIEAGADVFLRNIDSRTARHVSRGNLAISKLLRKAEDEWLWYRIHQGSPEHAQDGEQLERDTQLAGPEADQDAGPCKPDAQQGTGDAHKHHASSEALQVDDEDDEIDKIMKNMQSTGRTDSRGSGEGPAGANGSGEAFSSGPAGPEAPPPSQSPNQSKYRRHRIMEKCRDMHFSRAEVQQLQATNFITPSNGIEEFITLFTKLTQQGPRHRLPFLLSKPWVKELVPKFLEDERCHCMLLQSNLVSNEDFIRLLICNVPADKLLLFGTIRNSEQETMLHLLCKGTLARAYPLGASRADILSLLFTVCPPETFDLEARDLRGQTPLHLAAQSGDLGLVQVLLECGADPNAQEETTGWTPLHFSVAKSHYTLILQLLHHDATNVNQADKFDWPPLLEACSRLDARSTSLLVNGGANLSFRNQHQFDVLKAVDTSKKDLAAKRWMSCLMVSNGFRFEESIVQLNPEDRDTFERERVFHESRSVPASCPPFFVPDHLAPRCHNCKMLFSVTVHRYHCRSCGLVLCGDCFKWRGASIVVLDEWMKSRQLVAQSPARGTAAVPERPKSEHGGSKVASSSPRPGQVLPPEAASTHASTSRNGTSAARTAEFIESENSFDDPPLAEELPPAGPPSSVVCLSTMATEANQKKGTPLKRDVHMAQGGLHRERYPAAGSAPSKNTVRMLRLCTPCATFFETGIGETYAMLQRRGT